MKFLSIVQIKILKYKFNNNNNTRVKITQLLHIYIKQVAGKYSYNVPALGFMQLNALYLSISIFSWTKFFLQGTSFLYFLCFTASQLQYSRHADCWLFSWEPLANVPYKNALTGGQMQGTMIHGWFLDYNWSPANIKVY